MSNTPIAEIASWLVTALFLLVLAATGIYVVIRIIITVKHAASPSRRLGLLAALALFLCAWGMLALVGLSVTIMAVALDVNAAPSHPEHWRQLTVMGCSTLITIGLSVILVLITQRVLPTVKPSEGCSGFRSFMIVFPILISAFIRG